MSEVKISIIVPIYNVEKYIKRCMESLLKQSFDSYEIIAVNDGTLDNSMEYVYALQEKYNNIIICERENGGLSAARNTGIAHARGEYILFCDSDDALKENSLQRLYEEAKKNDLDMLLYDAEIIWDMEQNPGKSQNPYARPNVSECVFEGSEMLEELLEKGCYLASACMYLIKRKLIIEHKLRFYEKILHEDELFTPIVMIKAKKIEHKNWLIYERHMREGSIMTSDNQDKRMKSLAVVIKELIQFTNIELKAESDKKILWRIICEHIRFFLGQTLCIGKIDNELERCRKEIVCMVQENRVKLGIKFRCYLTYLHIKKIFVRFKSRA